MSTEPTQSTEAALESETDADSRLSIPTCPKCGEILPEDTTTGWSGECPSCHRVHSPNEVFR